MFFEAQKRFEQNSTRGQHFTSSYVRDVLRNYGNAGRPIQIQEQAKGDYERALQFRHAEKQKYARLEANYAQQLQDLHAQRQRIDQMEEQNQKLRRAALEQLFPKTPVTDAAATNRDGVGNDGRDSGRDVLPAAGHSDETDTQAREVEATISSTSVTDEPPSTSRRRPRGNNARTKQEEVPKTGGQDSAPGTDAGRALPDAPDEPEPDVGGSAAEHDAAE